MTRSRLPWILGALTVVILLASMPFLVLGLGTPLPESAFGFRGRGLVLASAFLVAGVLIATRVPTNPIGWVLMASGLGQRSRSSPCSTPTTACSTRPMRSRGASRWRRRW